MPMAAASTNERPSGMWHHLRLGDEGVLGVAALAADAEAAEGDAVARA